MEGRECQPKGFELYQAFTGSHRKDFSRPGFPSCSNDGRNGLKLVKMS